MRTDQSALVQLLTQTRYRELVAQYNAGNGPRLTFSPTAFLNWLFQEGHITDAQYRQLLASRQVAVSVAIPAPGYRPLGEVGRGAMGTVSVVEERDLGRTVALKTLHNSSSTLDTARFYREAQITAQLEHPAIVPVYRLEQDESGRLSYTMKLLGGRTLTEELESVRAFGAEVPEERQLLSRVRYFVRICEAIAYAHSRGIIHRDLKPDNIMTGAFGEVYVMDWGIARRLDDALEEPTISALQGSLGAQMTAVGAVMGTPAYMSPEQAKGERLGPGSDQYSLGLILQEMVTLKPAIPDTDMEAALKKAMLGYRQAPTPPPGMDTIPRELRGIMSRALALDPEDRYPDVSALIADLHRFLDGDAVLASPDSRTQRLARWFSQHRELTLLLLAGLLLTVLATSTLSLLRDKQARQAAEEREEAITRLLTITTSQSQRIERHFLRYEGLTMSLATAAVQSLAHSPAQSDVLYTDLDYADPSTAPPDLSLSPRYQREISTGWPVFKLAPGVDPEVVSDLMERLAPVRHTFRLAMLRSRGEAAVTLPDEQIHALLTEQGVPLVWAYVSLEEGLHMSYPGKGGYPADYDPRKRPWYAQTVGTTGPTWGDPYTDALGQGLLLPCTMSLFDTAHRFRGVAGVELTLDTIIDDLMAMPMVSGVRETLLLDQRGKVLVRSSRRGAQDAAPTSALPFADAETIRTVVARGSGYTVSEEDGLVVFDRLGSVGWFYVVTGDEKQMMGL